MGKTIGELQDSLTIKEYIIWNKFRHRFGPMNPVRMFDRGSAIMASQFTNAHGGKTSAEDFMPYGKEIKVDVDISEFINQAFGGKVQRGR